MAAPCRYKKPADWSLITQVAGQAASLGPQQGGLPILGNGDILTHYEAARRLDAAQSGCLAAMVGRGALIKPWLWQEVREGRELALGAAERVGVYRRLVSNMKAHFGDDARGRRSAFYFLPWCVLKHAACLPTVHAVTATEVVPNLLALMQALLLLLPLPPPARGRLRAGQPGAAAAEPAQGHVRCSAGRDAGGPQLGGAPAALRVGGGARGDRGGVVGCRVGRGGAVAAGGAGRGQGGGLGGGPAQQAAGWKR